MKIFSDDGKWVRAEDYFELQEAYNHKAFELGELQLALAYGQRLMAEQEQIRQAVAARLNPETR